MPPDDEPEKQNKQNIKLIYGGTLKEETPDLSMVTYALENNNNLKADDENKYEEEEAHAAAEPDEEDPLADQDIDNNFLPNAGKKKEATDNLEEDLGHLLQEELEDEQEEARGQAQEA